jgi:hypothetical protein
LLGSSFRDAETGSFAWAAGSALPTTGSFGWTVTINKIPSWKAHTIINVGVCDLGATCAWGHEGGDLMRYGLCSTGEAVMACGRNADGEMDTEGTWDRYFHPPGLFPNGHGEQLLFEEDGSKKPAFNCFLVTGTVITVVCDADAGTLSFSFDGGPTCKAEMDGAAHPFRGIPLRPCVIFSEQMDSVTIGPLYHIGRQLQQDYQLKLSQQAVLLRHSVGESKAAAAAVALAEAKAEAVAMELLAEENKPCTGRPQSKSKVGAKKGKGKKQTTTKAGASASSNHHELQEEKRLQALVKEIKEQRAEEAVAARAWEEHAQVLALEEASTHPQQPKLAKPHGEPEECPICLENYLTPPSEHMPVCLPCGHSLCLLCAMEMQAAVLSKCKGRELPKVQCPKCRQVLALPPGGAGALPCNYSVVELLEARREVQVPAPLAAPPHTLPTRIAALEDVCSVVVAMEGSPGGGYIARVRALELVMGGATSQGTLLARVAKLEQLAVGVISEQ